MADGKGTGLRQEPVRPARRAHPPRLSTSPSPISSPFSNPSTSERIAIVARRRLRPRHARARLRRRPSVSPALQADRAGARASSSSFSMCCGICASRSATPPAASTSASGLRKLDDTILHRHPRAALHLRRQGALRRACATVSQGGGRRQRQGVHRRQARRARRSATASPANPLSRRARRQGRQGRPARSPHAVLDRQAISTAAHSPAELADERRLHPRRAREVRQAARISSGRCAAICTS